MRKLILATLLATAASSFASHACAQLVIITNPNINTTVIAKDDVHDVFTGAASNLRNGPHARPVLLNKGAAHDEFLSTFIGAKNTQFRSNWSSLVFAGQASMPPSFDSEAEVVDYVSHHPFTFGYIRKDTPHDGVKILTIK
jgi:hypothetical protein